MDIKRAKIRWCERIEDHRLSLKIGEYYYPHISLIDAKLKTPLSVKFLVADIDDNLDSIIELQRIVKNDTTNAVWECFISATKFELLEGDRVVAEGVIL